MDKDINSIRRGGEVVVKYHQDHTWVRVVDSTGIIGITEYAQLEMGKVLYVELPDVEDELSAGEEFGQIESANSITVLVAPVSGEVFEINETLNDDPSMINEAPYKDGWLVKVDLIDPSELEDLLTEEQYDQFASDGQRHSL